MPSFSLRAIFLIVAVAAIGAAAIANANEWWTIAVTTATVLALVAATIAAGPACCGCHTAHRFLALLSSLRARGPGPHA